RQIYLEILYIEYETHTDLGSSDQLVQLQCFFYSVSYYMQ
ncbi:uncharacterized protein METZ01_LOCUS380537, partial [marine metagenome]